MILDMSLPLFLSFSRVAMQGYSYYLCSIGYRGDDVKWRANAAENEAIFKWVVVIED